MLRQVGFVDIKLVAETGFNSSPKTKGILISARKPDGEEKKDAKPGKA
jgi:hypothetical protein